MESNFKKLIVFIFLTTIFYSCENMDLGSEKNSKETTLVVELTRVSHLLIGDKVLCNGLEIGVVSKMELSKNGESVYVSVEIQKQIDIPMDSKFHFISVDLSGTKGIEVVYSNSSEFYQNMDTILGFREEMNFTHLDSLMEEFLQLRTPEEQLMLDTINMERLFKQVMDSLQSAGINVEDVLLNEVPEDVDIK